MSSSQQNVTYVIDIYGTPLVFSSLSDPLDLAIFLVSILFLILNGILFGSSILNSFDFMTPYLKMCPSSFIFFKTRRISRFILSMSFWGMINALLYLFLILDYGKYFLWALNYIDMVLAVLTVLGNLSILERFVVSSSFLTTRGAPSIIYVFYLYDYGATCPFKSLILPSRTFFFLAVVLYEQFQSYYITTTLFYLVSSTTTNQRKSRGVRQSTSLSAKSRQANILFISSVLLTVAWDAFCVTLLFVFYYSSYLSLVYLPSLLSTGHCLFLAGQLYTCQGIVLGGAKSKPAAMMAAINNAATGPSTGASAAGGAGNEQIGNEWESSVM